MEDQNFKELRNDVIEKFINLETLADVLITQHYFKELRNGFMNEVLYDEHFSFSLKSNILRKITQPPENRVLEKIYSIQKIRNYFVHRGREMIDWPGGSRRIRVIDPRDLDTGIDFPKFYKKFCDLIEPVSKYLFEMIEKNGGRFFNTEEELKSSFEA